MIPPKFKIGQYVLVTGHYKNYSGVIEKFDTIKDQNGGFIGYTYLVAIGQDVPTWVLERHMSISPNMSAITDELTRL